MKTFIKRKIENLRLRWAKTSASRYVAFLRSKGVRVGENCKFYSGLKTISIDITRPSLIEIGNNVAFNKNCKLVTHDYTPMSFLRVYKECVPSSGPIKIGNNVGFGMDCTVLKGVTIGDNCFIALGSIVTNDIPPNSIAAGAPAKVVSTLEEFYNKRKEKCVQEALIYARSIKESLGRNPRIEDFWEEFPLFLDGDQDCKNLPIKRQLGDAYGYYRDHHRAIFNGFDDFLKKAEIE